jgi:phosphatidylglycerophosphate synthase
VSGSFVTPETRARIRGLMTPIAMGLGRLGLTPNALTVIGFGIACLAAALAAGQLWLLAGLLVVFGGVFDLFDGALARATGTTSALGAFMDSVFDRWGEGVVYIGIAWGAINAGWPEGAVLVAAAMTGAYMVSYTRAKAENVGFTPGSGMANVGLAPREVRIAILTVGLMLAGIVSSTTPLAIALGLIAVLATITTIQRIVVTINQAHSQGQG